MSGSAYTALPTPVVANPLQAIKSGIDAANSEYGVREKQAQQAVGNILQQATDANGNVDYPKAQALAAQAGPVVQMGMATMLKDTSVLQGQQTNNAAARMKFVAQSAITIARNPSDENVDAAFDALAAHGVPAGQVASERARWKGMSLAQRQDEAERHGMLALDQLHQTIGQTTMQNTGGQIQPLTLTQPTARTPGGVAQGPGSVGTTLSPESTVQAGITYPATQEDVQAGRAKSVGEIVHVSGADVVTRFGLGGLLPQGARIVGGGGTGGGGVVDSSGKPVSPANPPRLLNVPGQPAPAGGTPAPVATPAGPPAPPGGSEGASSAPYTGGGVGTVLQRGGGSTAAPAPALPIPPAPPAGAVPSVAPAPPPSVNAPRDAMTPGPRAAIQGGVPVASTNALLVPAVGAASAPSPLVAGDVNAIRQGMDRARGTATPGTQVAGASFSTGAGYDEQVTGKASQERLATDTALASNYAANVFPQTQALSLYGRGMTTAPGSDLLNTAKGWAGGVARSMGFNGVFDETKEYDSLHKWLSQIVAGNPVAQGSDARLAATLSGNANTGIHELASADMLKAGIGLMRMNATASSEWVSNPAVRQKYGYYTNYLRDFNKTVDPRAFAWDMYNTEQKKTLADDLRSHREDPAYAQRLKDSLVMVRRNGYMGEIRAMP